MKQIIFKNKKQKYVVYGVGSILGLLIILSLISNIFANGGKQEKDGNIVYDLVTLRKQEPVSLEGVSVLESDSTYYYDSTKGEIDAIFVKNGD